MSEELTVEELDALERFFQQDQFIQLQSAIHPDMFDRLIHTARRALPDDEPITEEWLRAQGWFGNTKAGLTLLANEVSLSIGPADGLWIVFADSSHDGTSLCLTKITTRSQLTKLVEALGGTQ